MSRSEKLFVRLEHLESEFVASLTSHLEVVANGANTGFFAGHRFQEHHNRYLLDQNRPIEELLDLGDEIEALRDKLSQPASPHVAALHRACEEANNYANEHRLGPVRLAKRLLQELGSLAAQQVASADRSSARRNRLV